MPEPRTVHGPYDTAAAVRPDTRAVYEALDAVNHRGILSQSCEGLLLAALAEAGVQLGDYDRRIAGWLADGETSTVQVVIGWIERAHRSAEVTR